MSERVIRAYLPALHSQTGSPCAVVHEDQLYEATILGVKDIVRTHLTCTPLDSNRCAKNHILVDFVGLLLHMS